MKEIYYNSMSYKTTLIASFIVFLFIAIPLVCLSRSFVGISVSAAVVFPIAFIMLLRDFIFMRTIRIEIKDDYFKVTKFPRLFFKKEETEEIYYNDIKYIKLNRFYHSYHIYHKNSVFCLPIGENSELMQFIFILHNKIKQK